jgi:hypothetical protein
MSERGWQEAQAPIDELARLHTIIDGLRTQVTTLESFVRDRVYDKLLFKHGGYHGTRIYLEARQLLDNLKGAKK